MEENHSAGRPWLWLDYKTALAFYFLELSEAATILACQQA
jgi:hypothetical protein